MACDIIGDVHGHADELKALLALLGYRKRGGAWRHPERSAIFVGDFIDRGPRQLEAVDTVRRMVDAGSAQAVMGNHELNAIAWWLPDPGAPGEYLRPHHSPKYGDKNRQQHSAFLAEITRAEQHEEIIDWFLTLPLWLDLPALRVVHACWHERFLAYLAPHLSEQRQLNRDLMVAASREPDNEADKDTPEPTIFKAVEALLKGIETPLPHPHWFTDKDGHRRNRVRVRWWDREAETYRQAAMLSDAEREQLPLDRIPEHVRLGFDVDKPLFIGHYWLSGAPDLLAENVACVDYSVAKGGKLVAYRWDGEPTLSNENFRYVGG
ncbi:MAG: metallophosphoesterase [Burkholderiaceae bacterium]|nr:metallophosphoesterase [Burkholderiaceae bacterium]